MYIGVGIAIGQRSRNILAYTNKHVALGPIAYWPFAEASGSTAADASGNGRNGTYSGVTLGQAGVGDGRTAPLFDGSASFVNVHGASLAGAFSGAEGTLACWARVSGGGVWTDSTMRRAAYFLVDANNRVGFSRSTSNNQIDWLYVAGGTSKSGSVSSFSPTGWFHQAITWSKSADQVKFYTDGIQSGATQTGLGTWAGSLSTTQTIIGSLSTTPAQVWSGWLAHVAVFNRALTSTEIASLAIVS